MAKLSELVLTRNESSRFVGVSTMPHKLVKPVSMCVCGGGGGDV